MTAEIIRGINYVNPKEHSVVTDYPTRLSEGERGVHVVEMPTMRGYDGRLMVFGRFITRAEHAQRLQEYSADRKAYLKKHIQSLGEKSWHS
jgi:hypothetical protein